MSVSCDVARQCETASAVRQYMGWHVDTYVRTCIRTYVHALRCSRQGSPPAFQARATESFGIGKLVLFPVAAHLVALDVGKEIKRPSSLHPTLQAVCQMQVQIGGEDRLSVDTA